MLHLLKQIKKLKLTELKKLAARLDQIDQRPNTLFSKYLSEALNCCDYHFEGNNTIDEECACKCLCKNCEIIPTWDVAKRMQEIGEAITEENVILDMVNKDYVSEISIGELSNVGTFKNDEPDWVTEYKKSKEHNAK